MVRTEEIRDSQMPIFLIIRTGAKIGLPGAEMMAEALKTNTTLNKLDLGRDFLLSNLNKKARFLLKKMLFLKRQ